MLKSQPPINNTQLDPMEEILFLQWLRANGLIERRMKPEDIKPPADYRGLYKAVNGMVFPYGMLKQMAARQAAAQEHMQAEQQEREKEQNKLSKESK